MDLAVMPPVAPMLARAAAELPVGDWLYEPKWDGFRAIVFRDRGEVEIWSRSGRPLTRYFPEVADAVAASKEPRLVADGEIVVASPAGLDFDALSQRLHPAASRVRLLARSTPASLVAFDLLALGDQDLRGQAFSERRRQLVLALRGAAGDLPPVHLTPATHDVAVARQWFSRFEGAGIDGIVAKRLGLPYREGQREMVKVKHARTADFVVAGFRWHTSMGHRSEGQVGSLMLGLYDGASLNHVGVIGSFPAAMRAELAGKLAPYRHPGQHPWRPAREGNKASGGARPGAASGAGGETGQGAAPAGQLLPGSPSRWNPAKDASFEELEVAPPALLNEVFHTK
ncbi:MAG: ATP-dependent DNA ligase [Acidimicrobiales bacterium]